MSMQKTKTEQIEYETVTVRVPKKLMDWLKIMPQTSGGTPQQELEYLIVDEIRADIEGRTGLELIESLGLGPIFYELLKDERFKDC